MVETPINQTISSSRVAVTGMAWTTALGDSLDGVWQALLDGKSGMVAVPHRDRLRNDLAAIIQSVSWELPAAQRLSLMARDSITRALALSGHSADEPGLQLVLGTSLGAYLEDDESRQSMSGWARQIAREMGFKLPPVVLSTACSSGSDTILVGAELVRCGAAQCCVCGGADVLTWSKRIAHSTLGTMSPTRLRTFDVRHDGTLLGEGAAFLVLEPLHAGVTPLAILRGAGSANDAASMTAADVSGAAARYAMERSLVDAGLSSTDIGVINAHGSGTQMNDATESAAFGELFAQKCKPLVFATKGNFGHSLGATGAIEAIALILALRTHQVPPIVGLEQPIPDFPLKLPYPTSVRCDARVGLSLTLGFGGFDTSLIFEVAS